MRQVHEFSRSRSFAVLEGVLATLIWASSFVLVKTILPDIGPLTIAGLRYFLAFLVLLPFILGQRRSVQRIEPRMWALLALIGLSAYSVGNGALFWALRYLPATTVSFLMSASPILILLAGLVVLKEAPSRWQVVGVVIGLVGGSLFFAPGLQAGESTGLAIAFVGLAGFTAFGILGRSVARDGRTGTLILTGLPLAIGGGSLLIIGLLFEGMPAIHQRTWGVLAWLAIVNTAFAYFLYNHALKSITALEMNVLLNLSPLGTALLAWLLLGESLSSLQVIGVATVIAGVSIVQIAGNRRRLGLPAA